MEFIFQSAATPLVLGFTFLVIAGFYEIKTYRVPNALTLAAIFSAFAFSLVASFFSPDRAGGLLTTFVGMMIGGAVFIPFYAKGVLGAGCVKAQAAFGAWIGAGMSIAACCKVVLIATVVAAAVATVIYYLVVQWRKQERDVEFPSLIHGQLPLSIGTIIGVVVSALVI